MDTAIEYIEQGEVEHEYGHVCACCLELIEPNTIVYTLDLVRPQMDGGLVRHLLLLDDGSEVPLHPDVTRGELPAHTDPLLEALYFKDDHWDAIAEQLQELMHNIPPVEDDEPHIVECDLCGSPIRIGEKSALLRQHKLKESKRRDGSTRFEDLGVYYDFCLSCTMNIADLVECDMWCELSQNEECYHCTTSRCWRRGRCMCRCHAHSEDQ